jgi:hypothetical protein
MGVWGQGFFDGDEAADWSYSLDRQRTWKRVLAALGAREPDEFPSVRLAAAELVAAALGRRGDHALADSAEAFLLRVGPPGDKEVAAAIDAVDRTLADEQQLAALWADETQAVALFDAIRALRGRLDGTVTPTPAATPRAAPSPGPLLDWRKPEVAAWCAAFAAAEGPTGWKVAGAALMDGDTMSREPARSVALAAAVAVGSVFGAVDASTPPRVIAAARRLGVPATFVLLIASGVVTAAAKQALKRTGSVPDALVALRARLGAVPFERAKDLSAAAFTAGRPLDIERAVFTGKGRARRIERGDLIGLHLPEGWVLGRVTPTTFHGDAKSYVLVWFYAGFRSAPDDLADATFASLWVGPRMLSRDALRDPCLQVLDPSLRGDLDGASAQVWTEHPVSMVRIFNDSARSVGDLIDELRLRSGVGWRELLLTWLRHYAVHGHTEPLPGEAVLPRYVLRRDVLREAMPDLEARVTALLPEIGDVTALRWAWLEPFGYRRAVGAE